MSKLSDTQLIILFRAAAREDGCAVLPNGLRAGAAFKVAGALTSRKLMREVRVKPGMPVWRRDEEGRSLSLLLTAAGRKAIRVEEEEQPTPAVLVEASAAGPRPAVLTPSSPITDAAPQRAPRENTKQALVIKMLSAEEGATLNAIVDATGWQPHTTRAALTGLRKRGLAVTRERREGKHSVYRIAAAA